MTRPDHQFDPVTYVFELNRQVIGLGKLPMWTITEHPADFPDHFVARLFVTDQVTDNCLLGELEELREVMASCGMVCTQRSPTDDPKIVEVWF